MTGLSLHCYVKAMEMQQHTSLKNNNLVLMVKQQQNNKPLRFHCVCLDFVCLKY